MSEPSPNLFTQDSSYRAVYANYFEIRPNLLDFQIVLSLGEQQPDQTTEYRRLLAVHVSPHAAKALLAYLQFQIGEYERRFGEIGMQDADGKLPGEPAKPRIVHRADAPAPAPIEFCKGSDHEEKI